MKKITYLILLMVVACSKNLSSPQNNAPTINSFAVNRVSGSVPLQVNFTWSVYENLLYSAKYSTNAILTCFV